MVLRGGAKMMNILSMWMLLSSLGAAMMLSPEPILTDRGESQPLKAAKEASKQSVGYAADAARKTGEGVRETVAEGLHSTGEFANSAMDAVKDTSQAALEKIGLATPEKSTFDQWESGLQSAKAKAAAAARKAFSAEEDSADASASERMKLTAREKFENLRKYGHMEPPITAEIIKGKAADSSDVTKDAAGSAATAVKDNVVGAGERILDGAQYTYRTAEESAAAAKEKLEDAAGSLRKGSEDTFRYGGEKSYESASFVRDLAAKIAQSVEENIKAAGSKAYDTAGAAKDGTYDTMGTAYEYAADALKTVGGQTSDFSRGEESDPSYTEKLRMATEQAAEILRRRGEDAAKYMPNVGQGLSMGEKSGSDLKTKASEQLDYAQEKAGDQYQWAKDAVADRYQAAKEAVIGSAQERPGNWREEFLNQVGIRDESDLSKFDVVIGNVKGFWIGQDRGAPGTFQMAGEALGGAETETLQEPARSVKEKVSDTMHRIGDRFRHEKDSVLGTTQHMTEKGSDAVRRTTEDAQDRARDGVEEGRDSVSRTGSKLNDTLSTDSPKHGANHKKTLVSMVKWLGYATMAWVVSSIKAAHLLSFCSTYGTSLWVTFVSGYLLSKSLGRQQYGFVQSRMFPTYLRLIAAGQALCLVFYMMLRPWNRSSAAERLQHFNLWGVLLSTLINLFFLEPRATKTMFEKLKIEKEEGSRAEEEAAKTASDLRETPASAESPAKGHLNEVKHKFNVLHGWSSIFNLLGLMGETWHLWHLSRALAL